MRVMRPGVSLDCRNMLAHKSLGKYYQILDVPFGTKWSYLNQCPCNEYDSILRRHCLGVRSDTTHFAFKAMEDLILSLAREIKSNLPEYKAWTHSELMTNTRTKIKGRYQRAYESLKVGRHNTLSKMAYVRTFIKFEKTSVDKIEENKPARLIQHRSFEYLYLLKKYCGPLIASFKQSDVVINRSRQRFKEIFATGKTVEEMAACVEELHKRHKDCVVLCLDHSKWDGHVSIEMKKLMKTFWYIVSGGNKMLRRLLALQEHNKAKTKNGIEYEYEGTVSSGEFITSNDNSIMNYAMLQVVFPEASILVNGDDSLVFLSLSDYKQYENVDIPSCFQPFGMETKLDKIAFKMNEIDFCQCSPIRTSDGLKMVRKPFRMAGRIQYTQYSLNDVKVKHYLTGLGLCELASNKGVPVLQDLAIRIIQIGDYKKPLKIVKDEGNLFSKGIAQVLPVTLEARTDFAEAFGVSVQEQLELERIIKADYSDKYLFEFLIRNAEFTSNRMTAYD